MRSWLAAGSLGLALGACADAATDRTTRHPPLLQPPVASPAAFVEVASPTVEILQRLDELDARAAQLDALLAETGRRRR